MSAVMPARATLLVRARRLEWFTVLYNLAEGAVSVVAALIAGSVALLGFGLDSFVESASGSVLLWRLHSERAHHDPAAIARLDRRAHRLVAWSLFALAAWVAFDAVRALATGERPEATPVGIAVPALSMVVMAWLGREKRRLAAALASRALAADAFQTSACWWLSVITLAGIALNAGFGWWWADPAAALVMPVLLVREGREAWRGEACC